MSAKSLYDKFIVWKTNHVKSNQLLLFISFLIGILTALAAYILKSLIHFIQHLLTSNITGDTANYLYLIFPVVVYY